MGFAIIRIFDLQLNFNKKVLSYSESVFQLY